LFTSNSRIRGREWLAGRAGTGFGAKSRVHKVYMWVWSLVKAW
jgi:hypothetical protein